MVKDIFAFAMKNSGKEVSTDICEHFKHTRQELYDIVRVSPIIRIYDTDIITSHKKKNHIIIHTIDENDCSKLPSTCMTLVL